MARSDRHARILKTESRGKSVDAAVLICLWFGDSGLNTVLIKRNTYNGPHSGQISFPGGKREAADKTLAETALRETFEEVGLKKEEVHLLGRLTELDIPVSGFRVFPFVGYLPSVPRFHPDPSEVVEVIETDLQALHQQHDFAQVTKDMFLFRKHPPAVIQKLTVISQQLPEQLNKAIFCAWLSLIIAREMGMDKHDQFSAFYAGLLHDLGKLHMPDRILEKPGPLDELERADMNQHSFETYEILRHIDGLNEIIA